MSDAQKPEVGSITWHDLTIANADEVRDFYASVVGWKPEALSMGDYDDYAMNLPGTGDCAGGICHARGVNTGLPAQWLMYITVENVESSAQRCKELGGEVLVGPKPMGEYGQVCVIRDPAGAVAALISASPA